MKHKKIIDNLVRMLPYWHYKIERPLKLSKKGNPISNESYFCLIILYKHGPMKMSELSENLRLSKQQTTQIINKLYDAEFIERIYDEKDRRIIRIHISEKAKLFLKDNPFDGTLIDKQIGENLNEQEREELLIATETMLRLLAKLK